jgi:hypothetical protein
LAEFPALDRLWLYGDGIGQDAVEALTRAKQLTRIHVASADNINLSGLAMMPNLRMLGIAGQAAGALRGLSTTVGVSGLSLGRLSSAPEDPQVLARIFPGLTELQLYGSGWPEDLGLVADFVRLECLSLDHAMTARLGSLRVPATLRNVSVGFATEVDVAALARLPQLQRIELQWIDRPVDLSPFRHWNGNALTIETTPSQRLMNGSGLPPTIKIQRPRREVALYD